jgi:photosystem II stability/assembly factor-like uncharacterized protein
MNKLSISLLVLCFSFQLNLLFSQEKILRPVTVLKLIQNNDLIFAATQGSGVLVSTDFGETWNKMNNGLPDLYISTFEKINNTLVVTVDGFGIYISKDNANTWTKSNFEGTGSKIFLESETKLVANSTKKGLFFSDENLQNWNTLNTGFKQELNCIISTSSHIFYGAKTKGIYASKDKGKTIEHALIGLQNFTINAFLIKSNVLFAATNGGIYVSKDNAKNWTLLDPGLEKAIVYTLITKGDTLIAGTNPFGIIISTDNGKTWKDNNKGLTTVFIQSILPYKNKVFLGTYDGIFVSKDDAKTWEILNVYDSIPEFKKPTEKRQRSLIDVSNLGYEFANPFVKTGTNSVGLWQGMYMDLNGVFSCGAYTGMASFQDGDRTVFTRGISAYIGAQLYLSKIKSKSLNLSPFYGGGLTVNRLQNNVKLMDSEFINNNQVVALGVGLYGSFGLAMIFGPVVVKAKIQANACANFSKANDLKALQIIPSITVGFKTGNKFLRPKEIISTGNHVHQEIASTTIIGSNTYKIYTVYYTPGIYNGYKVITEKTTTVPVLHHTYKDVYTAGSIRVTDVGKHFFLAPKLEGSLLSSKNSFAKAYGIQAGFRVSRLLLEFSYSHGDIAMKDPISRSGKEVPIGNFELENENFYLAPMDGVFRNSNRVGMKLGLNVMYYKNKTNFVGNTTKDMQNLKKAKKATWVYGLVPTVGFGVMSLGDFKFTNENGENAFKNYISQQDSTDINSLENIPFNYYGINGIVANQTSYLTLGLNLFVGVVSLEYDLFIVKGKTLNHTFGVAVKFPIFRLVNSKNK